MRTGSHFLALGLATGFASAAAAALPLQMQDRETLEAIGVLIAVDHLRSACPSADRSPLSEKARAWDAAGGSRLRGAVQATRKDPDADRVYRDLERRIVTALMPHDAQACVLLQSTLASPLKTPPLAQDAPGPARTAVGRVSAPVATKPGAPAPIAAYGMILNYGMGYGGMMVARYDPVVLFRNGEILTEIGGLADPDGDRRVHPDHWSRWRQAGSGYEYQTRGGQWRKIPEEQVWTSPTDPTRLAGRFVHVGGGGNIALGGTSGVFVQTSYEFLPGGRLVREGVASASAEAGDGATRTVTGSGSGRQGGRYSVHGFTLDIGYDDGRRDSVILMTHPRDPKIIWLDGTSYVRK